MSRLYVLGVVLAILALPAKASFWDLFLSDEELIKRDLDLKKAFMVANACEAAYLSAGETKKMLGSMGVVKYDFIDIEKNGDTQVLIASTTNYSLICFRGTQEIADWKTNLMLSGKRISSYTNNGHVHSGFHNAWNSARPNIEEYLDSHQSSFSKGNNNVELCHQVLIGGHSLGGALALIAGIEWKDKYGILGVFTFGQPKVYSKEAKESYETYNLFGAPIPLIHRYVFKDDPVPSLPPGYVHIGDEKFSSKIGSILRSRREGPYWPSVGDHSMSNYVATLAALMSKVARSNESKAMVKWIQNKNSPLTDYLDIPERNVETITHGFTDIRSFTRCKL